MRLMTRSQYSGVHIRQWWLLWWFRFSLRTVWLNLEIFLLLWQSWSLIKSLCVLIQDRLLLFLFNWMVFRLLQTWRIKIRWQLLLLLYLLNLLKCNLLRLFCWFLDLFLFYKHQNSFICFGTRFKQSERTYKCVLVTKRHLLGSW